MKHPILQIILLFFFSVSLSAQEISETNTDIIYTKALEEYKNQNYLEALALTQRGLELAPEYHDIRILEVRVLWALNKNREAGEHLQFLIKEAPAYVDVKPLILQNILRFEEPEEALKFLAAVERVYPEDPSLLIRKAQIHLKAGNKKEARNIALDLMRREDSEGNRYALQTILNRTVTDEIGLNYQYIGFSEDYTQNKTWHNASFEYQHNFNRTAVMGRINYADRGYDSGTFYELEAYPVFTDKFYAFTNLGVSKGTVFPDARTSLSLFYNFARVFEAEVGSRVIFTADNSYFTGILGLTLYQGKFYLNARTFIGPERLDQMVQNYQGNIRYYLADPEEYFFLRIGSGISPDERIIFTQVQENPVLDAFYGNIGINKKLGIHHIFQIAVGALYEDINSDTTGTQIIGNIGYRYRF